MSAWDQETGKRTHDEEGAEDSSLSPLERHELLILMRPPHINITFVRFAILSVMATVCKSTLKKSRATLAEDAKTSVESVNRFVLWADKKGLIRRKRTRTKKGWEDEVWPVYQRWHDFASQSLATMADQRRRKSDLEKLIKIGWKLGADDAWEERFRRWMNDCWSMVKTTKPKRGGSSHRDHTPRGGSSHRDQRGMVMETTPLNRSTILTESLNRKRIANSQFQGRTPSPDVSAPSAQKLEKEPKTKNAQTGAPSEGKKLSTHDLHRQKLRNQILQIIAKDKAAGQPQKPLEYWLNFFRPKHNPDDIREAYEVVYGREDT